MATRRILLVAVSLLLLSFSGVLFSTSLILSKALENPGRTDHAALLRANDRYWHLFPLQLIAIGIVSGMIVGFTPKSHESGQMSRRMVRLLAFLSVSLVLLVFAYLVGIVAFSRWGNMLADYLKRQ